MQESCFLFGLSNSNYYLLNNFSQGRERLWDAENVSKREGPLLNGRCQEVQLQVVAYGLKLEGLEDVLGEKCREK